MSNIAKISVALTHEMNALVQDAVASGEYATSSEVIREALREWKLRRVMIQQDSDALRRLWQEGLTSGAGQLGTMDAIKQHARKRRAGGLPKSA